MKYRDNVCQPESGTINVDCNYRVNRERTEYLRDRLRECKAGLAAALQKDGWRVRLTPCEAAAALPEPEIKPEAKPEKKPETKPEKKPETKPEKPGKKP